MKTRIRVAHALAICLAMFSVASAAKSLSAYSVNKVIQAQQLAAQEKLTDAIQVLTAINSPQAYDQAFINRMLGVYLWQAGNTQGAIKALTFALSTQQLDTASTWQTKRMLADLHLSLGNYQTSLSLYQDLVTNAGENQNRLTVWPRIAQASYPLEQWETSLEALNHYALSGGKLTVNLLSIKLGAQLELKRYKSALTTVDKLIFLVPERRNFWIQKVSIQIRLNATQNALTTLQLADLQGVSLHPSDRLLLVQLYGQNGIPEKAARILETLDVAKQERYSLQLASYWQQAKEWEEALNVWQRLAKNHPAYYWEMAMLQLQQGQFQDALASLDKTKTTDSSKVALAKAQAYYQLGEYNQALINAKQSYQLKPSPETQRWVEYLSQLKKAHHNPSS
jgi:tetratricopeptide (TPR) repeat protein